MEFECAGKFLFERSSDDGGLRDFMKKLRVELPENSYDIIFADWDSEIFEKTVSAFDRGGRIITVSERKLQKLYPLTAYRYGELFLLQGTEEHKSMEEIERLLDFAVEKQCDRKSMFIAFGGGIVGDMTGFASAVFMRGIDFIQVPTTLLAMVDSSVGGKTGVNLSSGKNLAGAFHQPKAVLADVNFLLTLPEREIRNGLGEIVKYAVGLDRELFDKLEKNCTGLNSLDIELYKEIIYDCCAIKCRIVQQDEKEQGVRALLNLGHTFGHAVEAVSNFEITHGEAVSIGLVCAGELALKLGMWQREDLQRMRDLMGRLNLPSSLKKEWKTDDLISAMMHDKKTESGKLKIVLPTAIGQSVVQKNIPVEIIRQTMEVCCE